MEPSMTTTDWIAFGTFVVTAAAVFVAYGVDVRGRALARTTLFLQLRSRFLEVLQNLPPAYRDANWIPTSPSDVAASAQYWHHAYDEWYVARRLNPKLMGRLWDDFYLPSIGSGLQHPGLRRALTHILEEQPEMARHWTGFLRDIGVEH